jgi:hypothetical protein
LPDSDIVGEVVWARHTDADARSSQYVHDQEGTSTKLLSLLSSTPANESLSIGTTTAIPPTPESFRANSDFLELVHLVIKENAAADPDVQSQAAVYASQSGSALGSGGVFFPHQQQAARRRDRANRQTGGGGGGGSDGAGGASSQGGMGGAGRGGFVHVSDRRNPPDYGRVAWPEDIFGSVELDSSGNFVDGTGRYQKSGTYRIVTREGILGLSPFLRAKLVARLKELDGQMKARS